MTFLAGSIRVFALQRVPRLLVVKLFLSWLPMNQIEIFAVVLQVAPHAVFPVGILHSEPRVIAVVVGQALRDFFVAVQALKRWRARTKLMATCALRRATE